MAEAPLLPKTMRAVVLRNSQHVEVMSVPTPHIRHSTDAIIKVYRTGLCGSDLHDYRGHHTKTYNFIMGHEACGKVVQVGNKINNFKVGDAVVVAFTTSCGACFYCKLGNTSRCEVSQALGSPSTAGAQAEYLRVPNADTSMFHVPEDISMDLMTLMAANLPTGYMVAANAAAGQPSKGGVCVVIGCGPVGLCAISCASIFFDKVYAFDISEVRRKAAEKHGAIALPLDKLRDQVLLDTNGRGADAILEIVGHPSAMQTAMRLVRPCGIISSCGMHTHAVVLNGPALFNKNIRFQFGRCSVPTYFSDALEVLRSQKELFSTFIQHTVSLEEAPTYYHYFEQGKIGKVVFKFDEA